LFGNSGRITHASFGTWDGIRRFQVIAGADRLECEATMIGWALTFLLVALVAAVFGFGGIAGTAVEIAKLIFFVAIVLFAISAVVGLMRGRSPTV
jgi:uncharacterized membrane protein YtjA (UPF0391 family)